jgi:hypothetical protein
MGDDRNPDRTQLCDYCFLPLYEGSNNGRLHLDCVEVIVSIDQIVGTTRLRKKFGLPIETAQIHIPA